VPFFSVTSACQERLRAHLRAGDRALDATAGNGHDTLCLAQAVGSSGEVWAIDRQSVALEATRSRLAAAGNPAPVHLLHGDHADFGHLLPDHLNGTLAVAVFNLGYLPGGDRSLSTTAGTTLPALETAWQWLRPSHALLAIVCYPGHDQGAPEAEAVTAWARAAGRDAQLEEVRLPPTRRPAPFLLCLRR